MTPLIFAATCDLAGKVRGKAFPAADLEKRLARGVGWTPTNVQITCFDVIAETPFGALGDLLLVPDRAANAPAQFGDRSERFMLGDILTLEGAPWELCSRSLLKAALARLHRAAGVRLVAAFEHEFQFLGGDGAVGESYARGGFEARRAFCETLTAQIEAAGLRPDTIMKEYGVDQYEVTIGPEEGVRAADAAVMVRELARSTARSLGERVTFTPIRDPASVGNGVHIHMSFIDDQGAPATHDPAGPCGMSALTASFAAGVLRHLDAILALTAPSAISCLRLTPHRWSAAYNNLGFRDREASLRVCPTTARDPDAVARQFNIEYRAADAAASPYLALAAIVHAGTQGVEEALAAPTPTEEDLSLLSPEALAARGLVRLPESLQAALDRMAEDARVAAWFPPIFAPTYRAHKTAELAHVSQMDVPARCRAYEAVY